ncbi:MAG: trypsin-like peptidase domain-containing protein [Planctomycetota bacterium]
MGTESVATARQPALPNKPALAVKPATKAKRRDSMTQSLVLLATMTVMLLSARFIVPPVVEEIRYSWRRGQLRAEHEMAGVGLKNVSLNSLSQAYQMVTSLVGPSVVHIDVTAIQPSDEAWGVLGNGVPYRFRMQADDQGRDQGSGVVIDESGFLLTNAHVIGGDRASKIVVTLSDGRRREARVVGTDPLTDLAVLKIDADGLIPIRWGDSDDCKVGTPVWAVGSPFGLDRTVTFGILSGKHRKVRASTQYQDFMQSDVAVNPGNSGGPLIDATGSLIGINTAIVGDTYQGVSFSIPSNVAKSVYERLIADGRVQRAWLGVSLDEVPDDRMVGENSRVRGALVRGLADDVSPAAVCGMRAGDVVLSIGGVKIRDSAHLMQVIGDAQVGAEVTIKVDRDGEEIALFAVLSARQDLR